MAKINLSIDLTPANTTIYREGKGIVLDEPSRVLCQNEYDGVRIVACGAEAVKTQMDQFLIYPITKEGVDSSEQFYARQMLKTFVSKVTMDKPNANISAFFLVSCGVSANFKKHITSLAYYAGISEVKFVPYPIADYVGCGMSLDDLNTILIVDINHDNTDVAVVNQAGIVDAVSINFGTQIIDQAIFDKVRYRYGLNLKNESLAGVKSNLAILAPNMSMTLPFDGEDINSKLPKTCKICSLDIFDAIKDYYNLIASAVNQLTARQSPDIQEVLALQGVIFCGRGSNVASLREYMLTYINMPIFVANYECTVVGLGKLAVNKKLLKKLS